MLNTFENITKNERKTLKKLGFTNKQITEILYFRFEDNGSFNALNIVKTTNGRIEIINSKTTRKLL